MQDNIVCVKLLLDPSQKMPDYIPADAHKETAKRLPKAAVDVAADFIGAIYRHALFEIEKVVPRGYFDICEKQFVMSVPAVWSDKAKSATLDVSCYPLIGAGAVGTKFRLFSNQAATKAGISPVSLIKEPEAAALYTLRSLDFSLNVGDAFVICDAGGGTVDLISYEVVATRPRLELKELVPGSGKSTDETS
jgi:hypothetical protein